MNHVDEIEVLRIASNELTHEPVRELGDGIGTEGGDPATVLRIVDHIECSRVAKAGVILQSLQGDWGR
jgi:hypothetical protein